jgi:hypothetical protein
MTDKQKISWKRLAIEAAAIVASILLAFAIDAWWEESQHRKHLQTVMTGLEAAFSENVTLIDENIELVIWNQQHLKRFIEMDPSDVAQIPPEQTFDTLRSIWRPVTTTNNNSLLIATLESENLAALELPALQDAISRWRAQVNQLAERTEQLVDSEQEALLVLGRHPEVGVVWAQAEFDSQQLGNDVMRRVREDEELMAIAARRAFQARIHLRTLRANREASSLVLDLIRNALIQ